MVKFINKLTGSVMWAHETRVEEYKAAGLKLAADTAKEAPKPAAKKTKKK